MKKDKQPENTDEALMEYLRETMEFKFGVNDGIVIDGVTDSSKELIEEILPFATKLYGSVEHYSGLEASALETAAQEFEAGNIHSAAEAAKLSESFGRYKITQQIILRSLGGDPSDKTFFSDNEIIKSREVLETLKTHPFLEDPRLMLIELARNNDGEDFTFRNILLGLYGSL